MSKQETLSLKFCMVTGLPTRSITKYNFFVNPLPLVKLTSSFLTIHYNAVISTMQELVKEVTLINHMNNINGFALLYGITP